MNSCDRQNSIPPEQPHSPGRASPLWLGDNITDPIKAKTSSSSSFPAKIPFLYSLLTLTEAAAWWRMRPRDLSLHSKGGRARIPGIWLNRRVVRFSPLIMLAQLAGRAGIPMKDFLAAVVSQIPPYSDWNQLRSDLENIDEVLVKTGNRNDE